MADQIIDAVMARSIQADAERRYPLLGWVVMRDHPDYPGSYVYGKVCTFNEEV